MPSTVEFPFSEDEALPTIDISKNYNPVTACFRFMYYEAIKIIFIRVDSLTRKTFSLEIILGRGLIPIIFSIVLVFSIDGEK